MTHVTILGCKNKKIEAIFNKFLIDLPFTSTQTIFWKWILKKVAVRETK